MAERTYPGVCLVDGTETTKRKAKNDIKKCLTKERGQDQDATSWLVQFQGKYRPGYWIVLLIRKDVTLKAIDSKLRYLWLECCGHLSQFTIYGHTFQSNPDRNYGDNEEGMNVSVDSLFRVGLSGEHLYDFGDSTYLTFKVLDFLPFAPKERNGIELVAQNHPPDIRCSSCGAPADIICLECFYEGDSEKAFLCEGCHQEHECDEDMTLPVVNSPRMGQCGYEG
ncbi:MAG: Uncharacterized protein XE11_0778 [Methanomicrobiales archaeon 53_19]|jgi:hypothetical protein|uniref:hypothetical protein n=1 Tax=Methanocalculus sp. TaxID=2004547 RepID=UPI0007489BF5|nr:hypothetical protein [Methanocalculus sp.]KUK69499.1 MAG: Uncharacterized protein XD88_1254 [Methanocalculus sp. 52_23]KUL04193.1 MAG: Uncharacterized protein XE11_0778 [Methanomicrobiales archaeon 53_19]HIJ07582.1 hypothetical protein [Methanocalculus sp.]